MSEKATIVLAEDDPALVKALTLRLESEGYRVLVAKDGYCALAHAVEHKPDLMILDVHMPAGDGFTVLERKDRMTPLIHLPVIYLTGDTSEYTKRRADESTAAALIHKPFKFPVLLMEIERILGERAA